MNICRKNRKHIPRAAFGALLALILPAIGASAAGNGDEEIMALYFDEEVVVQTTSRAAQPLVDVAENVTIVEAEDIRRMNANTVSDILRQVPGIFISSFGYDYSNIGTALIHGSKYEHVTFLLDGVRLNKPAAGIVYSNFIPVKIIKRIEIVKGAASSTWGSALGGVVNIITKEPGTWQTVGGSLSTAVAENDTWELEGDLRGSLGEVDSYLYAGTRTSDGLYKDRFYDNDSFYGKVRTQLPRTLRFTFTAASMEADYRHIGYYEPWQFSSEGEDENILTTAVLDGTLNDHLSFSLSGHYLENDLTIDYGFFGQDSSYTYDQERLGATFLLTWKAGRHTIVAGAEIDRDEEIDSDNIRGYRADRIQEEYRAVFINDTIRLGDVTIIPGLRHDHSTIFSEVVSPSLGITWRVHDSTLLRFNTARGFRKPALNSKRGDPAIYGASYPHTELDPEIVWSYQAGLDTNILRYANLKTTFFYHEARKAWDGQVNDGDFIRKGVEVALRTVPLYDLSLGVSTTYVHKRPETGGSDLTYLWKFLAEYDNPDVAEIQLFGYLVGYDKFISSPGDNGKSDNLVWDLSLNRKLWQQGGLSADGFFVVRNLFNASQYSWDAYPNTDRWLEAGLRFHF